MSAVNSLFERNIRCLYLMLPGRRDVGTIQMFLFRLWLVTHRSRSRPSVSCLIGYLLKVWCGYNAHYLRQKTCQNSLLSLTWNLLRSMLYWFSKSYLLHRIQSMNTETCYCSVVLFLMIRCNSWQLASIFEFSLKYLLVVWISSILRCTHIQWVGMNWLIFLNIVKHNLCSYKLVKQCFILPYEVNLSVLEAHV